MKTKQWKLRKAVNVCASAVGGAACSSLPSWKVHAAAWPTGGRERAGAANCQRRGAATWLVACENAKIGPKTVIDRKGYWTL